VRQPAHPMISTPSEHYQKTVQVIFDDEEVANIAVAMASTFVAQASEDGIILSICQTTPPVIVGSPEDQRHVYENITSVKAKVLARFSLSRKRARELISILSQGLEAFEALEGTRSGI